MIKLLIFGRTGQLGQALEESLGRESHGIQFKFISRIEADISVESEVSRAVREFLPSIILNLAGWTNVEGAEVDRNLAFEANVTGPLNLAKYAHLHGARYLHLSTDYVFGGGTAIPILENSVRDPQNYYGMTKAIAEKLLLEEFSSSSVILRTSWLYGPTGNNFAKKIIKAYCTSDREISIVSDQIGQPTSSLDLCKKLIDVCLANGLPPILHATNGGSASWFDFASHLLEAINLNRERLVPIKTDDLNYKVIRPKYSVLSHQAWIETGIEPMRNWKDAATEVAPRILREVVNEIGIQ
jgi:dTDP-4-dehydrorhamnose reductase